MNELRVLALVPAPTDRTPGQRFRIEQWEPYLRREGIRVDFVPALSPAEADLIQQRGRVVTKASVLLRSFVQRARLALSLEGYDLVYVFRETAHIGPAIVERILVSRRVPYVFDFDDAVWVRYVSPANSYYSFLRFPGKTATSCRKSRGVLAGNPFLLSYAQRYNRNTIVVPTTIDTDVYRLPPPRVSSTPVIGWTGSNTTARYLEMLRPALERLRLRIPFKMVVVGAEGFAPRGVLVEHRPWRSSSEVQDLSDFDVGVMPLEDTEWERGKCALKALQYMALRTPPVISPVGANLEVVEDGVNGHFARSTDEWEEVLHALLTEPDRRRRLGQAARERVETSFSARVHAPRVAQVFREACR